MPATTIDLTSDTDGTVNVGGVIVQTWVVNAGTGRLQPFLTIQRNGTESGVNTDQRDVLDNVDGGSRTNALQVRDLPIVVIDGREYYSVVLDLNESNAGNNHQIDLTRFSIYLSGAAPIFVDTNGNGQADAGEVSAALAGLTNVFDLDAGGDHTLRLSDSGSSGSGWSDYRILIPREMLGVDPSAYVTFHVQMTGSDATFEEFATITNVTVAPAPVAGLDITNIGTIADGALDEVGENVAYQAVVTNTGNYALAGIAVTGSNGEAATYVSGDTDADGLLDVNESWTFAYNRATGLSQIELDAGGIVSNTATVTNISNSAVSDSATATNSIVQTAGLNVEVTGIVADGALDEAGETIAYSALVTNTGNYALAGVAVAGSNGEAGVYVSGDTDADGLLDVNESWTFAYDRATGLSQDELDAGGVVANTATVTNSSNAAVSDSASTTNPIVQIAGLNVEVSGTVADGALDEAGETIAYSALVTNTGNYALAGVAVTGSNGEAGVYVSGDTDADGLLDVNESWTFAYNRATGLSQDELDAGGVVANTATVTNSSNAAVSDSASTTNPIVQIAGLNVEVSGTVADGALDETGETIGYTALVTNTGNYALAGVAVAGSNGQAGVYVSGDTDADGLLDVNESWTFQYAGTQVLNQDDLDAGGAFANTATVTNSSNAAVSDSATTTNPIIQIAGLSVAVTGTVADGSLDQVGETIAYSALVNNTGNYALAGVKVTGENGEAGVYASGDTDADGLLDVGESWLFDYVGVNGLTQDDLDAGAAIVQTANAANPATSANGDAANQVVQRPSIVAQMSAAVPGGTADVLGEIVNYTLTVQNTGNVTLDGVNLIGLNDSYTLSGDQDGDGKLDVDETWTYTIGHAVTQAELDAGGVIGADIDVVAGSGTRSAQDNDNRASVAVQQRPGIDIENYVSTDGINWYDADRAGPVIGQHQTVQYAFVVRNTGNVTLTNVTLSDQGIDLNGAAPGQNFTIQSLAPNATTTHFVSGVWGGNAFSTSTTATGTYSAGSVTDVDALNYFGRFDGPGVRTPGFWSNNGLQFWNGKVGDEIKSGLNFTTNGELSVVGPNGQRGLLLGDWNGNGITDNGERTLFMSLTTAQTVINASLKSQQDARFVLGRDSVASWLNELAGNDLGDAGDAGSPREQLQSAIDWLRTHWDANHDGTLAGTELNTNASAYRTSGANWNGGTLSAATLHTNLDNYNNTGALGGRVFSADGDDNGYLGALQSSLNNAASLEATVFLG